MARRILMDYAYRTEASNYYYGDYDIEYVSSIRPDQSIFSKIEAEKKGHIVSFSFNIVNTREYEDGSESLGDTVKEGPKIYVGESMSIEEAIFCYGSKEITSSTDGKQVERFCIDRVGTETTITPMKKGEVTLDEYILMLMKYPDMIKVWEEGIVPVTTPIHK